MKKLGLVLVLTLTLLSGLFAEDNRVETFSKSYDKYTVTITVSYDKDSANKHFTILKAADMPKDYSVYVTDKETALGEWLEDYAQYLSLTVCKEYHYTDGRKNPDRVESELINRMSADVYVVATTGQLISNLD